MTAPENLDHHVLHEWYLNREFVTGNCGHLDDIKVDSMERDDEADADDWDYAFEQVEGMNKALKSLVEKGSLRPGEEREPYYTKSRGTCRRDPKLGAQYVLCDLFKDQIWIEVEEGGEVRLGPEGRV